MTKTLSQTEAQKLAQHEVVVERGLSNFAEVGAALKEIRDRRLYRERYGTFEEYVKGRFQLSRPRAYELIAAAEADADLSGIPDKPKNTQQAVALSKAPKEQRAEVWAEVVAEGKPTAAKVEAAVNKRIKKPATPELSPEKKAYVSALRVRRVKAMIEELKEELDCCGVLSQLTTQLHDIAAVIEALRK